METNIYFYPKSRALRKFYIYEKTTVIPILNYLLQDFFIIGTDKLEEEFYILKILKKNQDENVSLKDILIEDETAYTKDQMDKILSNIKSNRKYTYQYDSLLIRTYCLF
jgi:hypothetical protein